MFYFWKAIILSQVVLICYPLGLIEPKQLLAMMKIEPLKAPRHWFKTIDNCGTSMPYLLLRPMASNKLQLKWPLVWLVARPKFSGVHQLKLGPRREPLPATQPWFKMIDDFEAGDNTHHIISIDKLQVASVHSPIFIILPTYLTNFFVVLACH